MNFIKPVLAVTLLCSCACAYSAWVVTEMNNEEKSYTFENAQLKAKVNAVRVMSASEGNVLEVATQASNSMGCTVPVTIQSVALTGYSFDCPDDRFVYVLKQSDSINMVTAYCGSPEKCEKAAEFISSTFNNQIPLFYLSVKQKERALFSALIRN